MNSPIRSAPPQLAETVSRKIDQWKASLLDMSRRNRLLFYRPTKASTAEIVHPTPEDLFDRLVVKGRTLMFPIGDEVQTLESQGEESEVAEERNYGPNEIGTRQSDKHLARVLYNLRNYARTAREEQGVNVLFLAFGLLHWRESPQSELSRAPLVLVPVELGREAPGKPYQLSMLEDDIVINPTLREKLAQDFQLELPGLTDELDAEGLVAYWRRIAESVANHSQWQVERAVVLGNFSFQDLMIFTDIERNRHRLAAHPIIEALAVPGLGLPNESIEPINAREIDDRVPPSSVFQVLDADSSQQEAILAAKAGLNFILQGPPGTGKSQTIANIIAEYLAEGRRVLFVSEKMAALEVVHKRLEQVGLGQFCLEIHSHRRNKKEVVNELGETLQAPRVTYPGELQDKLRHLARVRKRLNEYVRALHAPRFELQKSIFRAYGELAQLENAPAVPFRLPNVKAVSTQVLQEWRDAVVELASFSDVIDAFEYHPWRGARIAELTLQLRADLESALRWLAEKTREIRQRAAQLSDTYGVKPPATFAESVDLAWVARQFTPRILEPPLAELHKRYSARYQSVFRYVSPQYWQDSALLRSLSYDNSRPNPKTAVRVLAVAKRLQTLQTGYTAPAQLVSSPKPARTVVGIYRRIHERIDFVTDKYTPDEIPEVLRNWKRLDMEEVAKWCLQQADTMDALADWVQFERSRRRANDLGLGEFVEKALASKIPARDWPDTFFKRFYILFVDGAVHDDQALTNFQSGTHRELIQQFQALDQEHFKLSPRAIQARLSEERPDASWMTASSSEEAILRREMNKRRRLKSLRRLFAEIPELILTLRPCLLMSPLTVSQLLDPDLFRFDVVVFDEASQIPPEHAVGAFIRAKQVIIVGDRRQLPPTRFFAALETEGEYADDDQEIDTFESILDEADAAGLPSKLLLWHYRSRDESLIAFSNYHFYANRLFTFPCADRESDGTGLEFVYVPDGMYKRGTGMRYNLEEARRVVQLVLDHFRTTPELSLGVVAFSQAQRDAIRLELERMRRDWPSLEPFFADKGDEPFFVKNLELVQGDERDVMIFSVGYGRDETGRFLLNFGPLNKEGGERRLNVAVTRARRCVKLVASIQPEDIDLARTNSRGVQLFRSYMTVARDGLRALYAELDVDSQAEFESPFEASVYNALTVRGLQLRKQVGVSGYRIDLAVVDSNQPGKYLLGIECDGAMYHSAATARDRDRLRQLVLEGLGWRIHRIWSRDWIENREREIQRILEAVKTSKRAPSNPRPSEPGVTSKETVTGMFNVEVGPGLSEQAILPNETQPYNATKPHMRGIGASSFHNASLREVIGALEDVVEEEGPIHLDVASRRVADAWGIGRVGHRVQERISLATRKATQQGTISRRDDFLWPAGMQRPPVRVPYDDRPQRHIEEIAIEELAEGAYLCMKSALSLDEDDLIRQTARLFGLRANQTATERISRAIRQLLDDSRLERRSGKIRILQR